MKTILLVLSIGVPFLSGAQCNTWWTLYTQADVDAWVAAWGGTCTEVAGLRIGEPDEYSSSDITDLSGLTALTHVTDALIIMNCPNLTDLSGLENIVSVGGYIWLIDLPQLGDLSGLSGLTSIGSEANPTSRSLIINYCDGLENLNGLESLTYVGEDLDISYSDGLLTLDGLQNLTHVGSAMKIRSNDLLSEILALSSVTGILSRLDISNNLVLENVDGLNGITEVTGECRIIVNPSMNHLHGLSGLTTAGYRLEIRDLNISNLTGLEALTHVEDDLEIQQNRNLSSLDGLLHLVTVGGNLDIWQDSMLSSVAGMNSLTNVGGSLLVNEAHALSNLQGFESLQSVGGYLEVSNNAMLMTLTGMDNVTSVGTNITIGYNPLLTECAIATVCSHIQNGGEIYVYNNAAGCANVTQVTNACAGGGCGSFMMSTTATHTTCGFDNGAATVIPTGGVAPYSVTWSTGAHTETIIDLPPGTYHVTVLDFQGCPLEATVSIDSSSAITVSVTSTDIICGGICSGIADATQISNGAAPYIYNWSNGMSTGVVTDLCPGVHSVTVTDENGCIATASVNIAAPDPLVLTVDSIIHITEGQTGTIDISVTGGTAGYQYLWSGPNGYAAVTEDLVNLGEPGCYSVTITDVNGCTAGMDDICIEDQSSAVLILPNSTLRIFPNPVRDFLHIAQDGHFTNFTCMLFRCDGTPIGSYINVNTIDLSKAVPGVYILRMRFSDGHEKVTKIVVSGN